LDKQASNRSKQSLIYDRGCLILIDIFRAKERIRERNAEMSGSQKMEYRIGINIGDVVDEEGRIYGDGVNIAARLEALAEPGGICISGLVYSHVKNKLKLEYEFLGKQTVKNISEPVKFNHERNCCSAKSNNDRFHSGIASL
jgi:class 3 adenylate cyclase